MQQCALSSLLLQVSERESSRLVASVNLDQGLMSYEATLFYVASPYEPAGPDRYLAIGCIRWGRGRERLPDAK